MVAIILQDSFLPTPASDLLFLGADLREIRSQSPEALAAKTQSICVLSGTSVSWQISEGLCFFPFFRNIIDFWDVWAPSHLARHVDNNPTCQNPCFIFMLYIYRHQLHRLGLLHTSNHQPVNTVGWCCCVCLSCQQMAQPETKSPELEYFLSHFQISITQLNIVRFLKSQVVLNFSCSALQYSDITF